MFYHKHADLRVSKPLGCTELIYFPMHNHTKLYDTAQRGTLAGMYERTISYKVYCLSKKNIVHNRVVTFIEEENEQLFIEESKVENMKKTNDQAGTSATKKGKFHRIKK